jgi:chemotaxis protein MotB
MKKTAFVVASLALVGCGVPEAKYNAALKDATDARAELQKCNAAPKGGDDSAKRIADLEAQLKDVKEQLAIAEGKATTDEEKAQLEELKRFRAEAEARQKLMDDLVAKFKKLIDTGKLKVVVRRGRLVLQLHNEVLFDPAKAEIKPAGKAALTEIAATLKTVTGRKFQIAGHTDAIPIKSKEFPSNWELSTARALEVLRLLVSLGVNPAALSAAGYGPYDPVGNNNTGVGQALNRRIEITLVPDLGELAKLQDAPKQDAPKPDAPK